MVEQIPRTRHCTQLNVCFKYPHMKKSQAFFITLGEHLLQIMRGNQACRKLIPGPYSKTLSPISLRD